MENGGQKWLIAYAFAAGATDIDCMLGAGSPEGWLELSSQFPMEARPDCFFTFALVALYAAAAACPANCKET